MKPFIILDRQDNVATAITDLPSGFVLEDPFLGEKVTCSQAIPSGHKVALSAIDLNGFVKKYGVIIGKATADITPGELVHVHNLRSIRGKGKADSWSIT